MLEFARKCMGFFSRFYNGSCVALFQKFFWDADSLFERVRVNVMGGAPRVRKQVPLPPGAKLDYREDVDALHAKVMAKVEEHFKKTEAILRKNATLVKKMQELADKQKAIFAEIDIELGEPNPVVEMFGEKLEGIDEFAALAREGEIKYFESMGLHPEGGWDAMIVKSQKRAKSKNTFGELSNLLLNNKSKSDGSVAGKGVEEKSSSANHSIGENGFTGESDSNAGSKKTQKRIGRKMRI
jgi:hypothetical protein